MRIFSSQYTWVEVGRRLLQDSGLILGRRVRGTGFSAMMDTKSDVFYPETATTLSQRSTSAELHWFAGCRKLGGRQECLSVCVS